MRWPNSSAGQAARLGPNENQEPEKTTTSIPIPGTPFRLSAEGRLLVAVDLQELLTDQGIPRQLAERLAAQKDPEDVAKVLLNALYLQSQGKLQNGPGYIRAGIEDGYDLLPAGGQPARKPAAGAGSAVHARSRFSASGHKQRQRVAEEAAINLVIERLPPEELEDLVRQAVASLPEPIVRRNPTLSNPFVRGKVYELACGEPLS